MKKTLFAAVAALFAATQLVAESYTYTVRSDGKVVILSYAKSTSGAVTVPSKVDGKTVVALQGAFNGCKKVTSITIPATVKEIGPNTFKNTSKLTSLKFADGSPGVTIGDDAFSGSKLKELTLPANSKVADFAFYDSQITTLEVCDKDPDTNLSNIDVFLNPYNSAGTKLMCEIKKLVVPTGCKDVYESRVNWFINGRKKKNWGTVVAQYPRVFAEKTYSGAIYLGTGYFMVGKKKIANGTPVKPGTKVKFVATAAAGYTPEKISYADGGGYTPRPDLEASWTFTMPKVDRSVKATFIPLSVETTFIDSVADTLVNLSKIGAIKGKTDVSINVYHKSLRRTQTTISVKGLPKGLSLVFDSDDYYRIKGVPTTSLDCDHAPAIMIIKGASGYSRAVKIPLEVSGFALPSSTLAINTSLPQTSIGGSILAVLSGMSYSAGSQPVLISAAKKISVKASGLPKGIKLSKVSNFAYTLAGRPTVPGVYVTTLTVTVGGKKETHKIAYEVRNNPLAGSYRGYVSSYALGAGAVTMSVKADGKATLTFTEGSAKTTVTGYPSFESGSTWSASTPLVGQFRFSFSVPKDKKRKLGKRTLKLAFLTDSSSGVAGVARVRQGPISGFSLTNAEVLRLFPTHSVATVKAAPFYKEPSKYLRYFGGFTVLIGPSTYETVGEAMWAAAAYDYDVGKVMLNGRLPAGKLFSASVPFVAAYRAQESWTFSETSSYRAIEAAPLVVKDSDGVVYVIKIPTDPTEFYDNGTTTHDAVGIYAWGRDASGSLSRLTGIYANNNQQPSHYTSARSVFASASPTLKLTFDFAAWDTVATKLSTSVDTTSIGVGGKGKIPYEFDPETGLWAFDFEYGGLIYTFEGIPLSNNRFYGMIGRSADGKKYLWGAAKVE